MGIANPVSTYQHAKASTPMYIVEIDAIKKKSVFFFHNMRVYTVHLDNAFVQHFEIVQSVQYDSQAS